MSCGMDFADLRTGETGACCFSLRHHIHDNRNVPPFFLSTPSPATLREYHNKFLPFPFAHTYFHSVSTTYMRSRDQSAEQVSSSSKSEKTEGSSSSPAAMSTEMAPLTIRVGSQATKTVYISQENVTTFGNVIDDHNPIHSDPEAAQAAGFPTTICYGMYAGSLFSGLMAKEMPGPGTVYLSQNLRFTAPVFVGDDIQVIVEVREFRKDKGLVYLSNILQKTEPSTGKTIMCVDGSAVVMNKNLKFEGESEWSVK
ncbi:MaoC like domain/N-terminal half of MaoC dehydratase, putative [Leishmania lindenbergi]|uniref:MaoC like domain/N-terminal half of MaoC dehydratase n=1 Tax=Leishmania lindenbergi TaxID=651832 RepID=A0AAW3AUV1_9TRYP